MLRFHTYACYCLHQKKEYFIRMTTCPFMTTFLQMPSIKILNIRKSITFWSHPHLSFGM